MNDLWTDRLSDYLADELPAPARAEFEQHLAGCTECTTALAEIEEIVRTAATLPERQPPHDLWAGIAARLDAPRARAAPADAAAPVDATLPAARRGGTWGRVYRITLPQLAAAAVVLMTISAGAAALIADRRGASGPAVIASAEPSGTVAQPGAPVMTGPAAVVLTAAEIDARYSPTIENLERTLAAARDVLDPQTVEVLEQSLAAVDAALAEARDALMADPNSAFIARHLEATTQRKLELLLAANRVAARI